MGLDSLLAVELRNRLQADVGRGLPTTVAFDHPTAAALAEHIARDVLEVDGAVPDGVEEAGGIGGDVLGLSEDEATALLLEELVRTQRAGQEVIDGG
jgi:hypothetical protein